MTPSRTPTTDQIVAWVGFIDTLCGHGGESTARFNRWLASRDAEVLAILDARDDDDPDLANAEAVEALYVLLRQRASPDGDGTLSPSSHQGGEDSGP